MIHITSDGGRSWQSRELEISGTATKLKFHTPEQGFLIQHTGADNRTKTICNLLASRDGGENWFVVKSFNRLLTDLHAIDAENFLVVGERGFISRTSDRGMSWKRSYTKVQSCLNVIELNGYGKGIAAGDFGAILISDDHGEHWFRFGELEEPYNVVGVSFVDPNQAILATDTSIFSLTL